MPLIMCVCVFLEHQETVVFCIDIQKTHKIFVYEACLFFTQDLYFILFFPLGIAERRSHLHLSFFCFQVSAGFGQLLLTYSPFPASFHPNSSLVFSENPICSIYLTRWSKRLNCSSIYAFSLLMLPSSLKSNNYIYQSIS